MITCTEKGQMVPDYFKRAEEKFRQHEYGSVSSVTCGMLSGWSRSLHVTSPRQTPAEHRTVGYIVSEEDPDTESQQDENLPAAPATEPAKNISAEQADPGPGHDPIERLMPTEMRKIGGKQKLTVNARALQKNS